MRPGLKTDRYVTRNDELRNAWLEDANWIAPLPTDADADAVTVPVAAMVLSKHSFTKHKLGKMQRMEKMRCCRVKEIEL